MPFDAEAALSIGAVNAIVDDAELEQAVLDFAGLAARAGAALASGRRSCYRLIDLSYDEALDQALDEFAAMFRD